MSNDSERFRVGGKGVDSSKLPSNPSFVEQLRAKKEEYEKQLNHINRMIEFIESNPIVQEFIKLSQSGVI